jgi:hypothetical protein
MPTAGMRMRKIQGIKSNKLFKLASFPEKKWPIYQGSPIEAKRNTQRNT